jgi:hypothetical protein
MNKIVTVTEKIDVNEVRAFYTGRPGCMCGCLGNYKYASQYREECAKSRGYAISDDEVSDRAVKMGVTKFNKLIDEGLVKRYEENEKIFFYDTDTRTNVMYLQK